MREKTTTLLLLLLSLQALLAQFSIHAQALLSSNHRRHYDVPVTRLHHRRRPHLSDVVHLSSSSPMSSPQSSFGSLTSTSLIAKYGQGYKWEGDDIRRRTWMKRRFLQRRSEMFGHNRARSTIVTFHSIFYIYQVWTTMLKIRRRYPTYWTGTQAIEMVIDSMWGGNVIDFSPVVTSFGFSVARSSAEPFRYFTSGWIHASLLHFLLTSWTIMSVQPSWLERGLGWPIYLTTYILGIVTGNMMLAATVRSSWDMTLCLGPTAGLCALWGLQFIQLFKMGTRSGTGSYRQIFKGLVGMFAMGWFMDTISNACNVGGFLGGIVIGIICGPSYVKDYTMRRKNSVEFDPSPRDYRRVMGFGIMPTRRGVVPLTFVWIAAGAFLLTNPKYQMMPSQVLKALLRPLQLSS